MNAYTCSAVQQMATSIFKCPTISQQYTIYMARAISSRQNAVRVLPVPDTARKRTCPATFMKYDELITIKAGAEAYMNLADEVINRKDV